jgi:hypothetical protein
MACYKARGFLQIAESSWPAVERPDLREIKRRPTVQSK